MLDAYSTFFIKPRKGRSRVRKRIPRMKEVVAGVSGHSSTRPVGGNPFIRNEPTKPFEPPTTGIGQKKQETPKYTPKIRENGEVRKVVARIRKEYRDFNN